jgi:Ca2+-binding RTX toxin-like protein
MAGGTGNDTYNVNDAGDLIMETKGEGTDTVFAFADYTLAVGSAVEVLRSSAATAVTLTGNEFNNSIIGGAANYTLFGGDGDAFAQERGSSPNAFTASAP